MDKKPDSVCGVNYDENGYCLVCQWDEYSHSDSLEYNAATGWESVRNT
jgi:hypothetical protein